MMMTIAPEHPDTALIQTLETASMRAWPALATHFYGGWVLRFANGYTGRANAIHPLYDSDLDLSNRIEHCESLYRARNLPVRFKLTAASQPATLDDALTEREYERSYEVCVMTSALERIQTESNPLVRFSPAVSDEWLWHFLTMSGTDMRYRKTIQQMLQNIIPKAGYAMLEKNGDVIALGIGVVENDLLGLFKIETAARYRRQGYGSAVVSSLLEWGKSNGATTAYLQTEPENEPALNLYAKFGFEERYRYWYRMLHSKD